MCTFSLTSEWDHSIPFPVFLSSLNMLASSSIYVSINWLFIPVYLITTTFFLFWGHTQWWSGVVPSSDSGITPGNSQKIIGEHRPVVTTLLFGPDNFLIHLLG